MCSAQLHTVNEIPLLVDYLIEASAKKSQPFVWVTDAVMLSDISFYVQVIS